MTVWSLAAFAGGFLVVGVATTIAVVLVTLPQLLAWVLARYTHAQRMAVVDQAKAYAIARAIRPRGTRRRQVRWGRWVGGQRGRHLT